MRIDLKSGAWIEIRDGMKGSDRSVQNAVTFTVQDGKVAQEGGVTDKLRNALLALLITNWSLTDQGIPIPSMHADTSTPEGLASAAAVVAGQLDLDDYNELAANPEVEARLAKVSWGAPNQNRPPSTA